MKTMFYAGASGLIAQQGNMNNIGHNMANANTDGFLTSEISFASLLNTEMYVNTPNDPLGGAGVKTIAMGINTEGGSFRTTDNMLDFAIIGDGFFAVEDNGQTEYTKAGAFAISIEGDNGYLTTPDGAYVLDSAFNRIALQKDLTGQFNLENLTETIGVFEFSNPTALDPVSTNRYVPTVQSGQAFLTLSEADQLLQGVLKTSNVSVVDEMSELISAQRAYQISAKVVQTADENEQVINSLRN